jgi:hypothetical protein
LSSDAFDSRDQSRISINSKVLDLLKEGYTGGNLNTGVTQTVRDERDVSNDSVPKNGPGNDLKIPLLIFISFSLIYVLFIAAAMHRRVWYDELFTFDIARASTPSRVMELIRKWDLNPPLSYFFTRWSMAIVGQGKLGLRLASIVEFYTASLFLFAFARKRIGNAFALLAISIIWEGPLFYYAVEARPYALLAMCFSILIFCWDRATSPNRPIWSLLGTFFAALGMLLTHVFAPLTLAAIFVGEGVRFARSRKADIALWTALLLPCVAMLLYIPLFHTYRRVLFPYHDQAALWQIPQYFIHGVWNTKTILYATVFAFIVSRGNRESRRAPFLPEQLAAAFFLLCLPILLNLILMPSHGAFWPRYCITTSVTLCLAYAFLGAYQTDVGQRGGYVATGVVLLFGLVTVVSAMRSHVRPRTALATVRPDLPLVVENGMTFFEMNHFEDGSLLNRVHYLEDPQAYIKYPNSNLFDGYERLDPEFHIRGHVDDYASFLAQHSQFLMLTEGRGVFWLVSKLHDDGEEIEKISEVDVPYGESEVYLVTVRKSATDN